jgi:hypothetical protein
MAEAAAEDSALTPGERCGWSDTARMAREEESRARGAACE